MQTFRFINNFIPKKYDIKLDIKRPERHFDGLVTIEGQVPADSSVIKLNCTDLEVETVQLDGEPVEFSLKDNVLEFAATPGDHLVTVKYHAQITDSMRGMYPCYYKDGDTKKELIATQFESCSAREAFPCVDEPEAKATFDLSITTETGVTVLSNMPIKSQDSANDRLTTIFETTPIMSTYLLAWAYGDLHSKSTKTKDGIDISVWATKAQPLDNLDFALDIAKRSIEFYEDYFGIKYPIKKSDQIALPDFAAGAMENWGLVTYREQALLCDPKLTPVETKHYVATVIAHELSHQWFGDLVTMRWWNDLWLNESFATMMEYKATNALEPKWNIWLDFNQSEVSFALGRDSLEGVQPVRIDVTNPSEIDSIFDGAIVYAKGSRLIKMLESYVGEENFRIGLHNYFEKHAYSNTEAADLWDSLSETSHKPINEFMDTWLNQPGFPVLTAKKAGQTIQLSQTRLVNLASKTDDSIWPIVLGTNLPGAPELMDTREMSISLPSDFSDAVRFNIGNNAHFITNYDENLLSDILRNLAAGKLSEIDRVQLLTEQCMLAEAGLINGDRLIDIIKACQNDESEAVWSLICHAIGLLKEFVHGNKIAKANLREFVRMLVKPKFDLVGWDQKPDEDANQIRLRSLLIDLLVYTRDEDIIAEASRRFSNTSIEKLNPELRDSIMSAVVRNQETDQIINQLIDLYRNTSSTNIKADICRAVTKTKNPVTIDRILHDIMDKNIVKPQDFCHFFVYMIYNPHARKTTWQWMKQNWDWIYNQFKGDNTYDDYPKYSANALIEKEELVDYQNFFEPMMNDPMLTRPIKIGINGITNRILVIEHSKDAVADKLANL